MPALKRKTKTPVLVERIDQFVGEVREAMKSDETLRNRKIRDLWDAEVRYHFDNGRTEKTLELYIMKYRYALKAEFGPKSTPLAICNMKKLRERLKTYIERADYPKNGVATSIVEKIERAEFNTMRPQADRSSAHRGFHFGDEWHGNERRDADPVEC